MQLIFFVEEPSAEAALMNLLGKILPNTVAFKIIVFQGKQDLLSKLNDRLRAYKTLLKKTGRLIVLVDRDREDCHKLKRKLEEAAQEAGLMSKSRAGDGAFTILNRLAIEELEAWFFGDPQAVAEAYPKIPVSVFNKAPYRNPDSIKGGTAEALERILKSYRYYQTGMPKIEVARRISAYMEPRRNKSKSFQVFRRGIESAIGKKEAS